MRSSRTYVVVVAVVLVLSTGAYAGPKISAHLDGVKMFGHTAYDVPEYRESEFVEREVEFPLNPLVTRLNIGIEGTFSGGTPWRFLFDIGKNVNNPGSPMKDTGWLGGEQEGHTAKYLYLESDADLGAWLVDVSGRLRFCRHRRFSLEAILGYGYRKFSYDAFGLEGWIGDPSYELPPIEAIKVVDYDVTYHIPYVGIGGRVDLSPAWVIDGDLAYSPRTVAKHNEDCLYRNRKSDADCTGKSIISSLAVRWAPGYMGDGPSWFIGAGAEIVYTTTDGDEVQSWYGEDPYTEEPQDTGKREPSIDTEIKGTYGSLYVNAGITM